MDSIPPYYRSTRSLVPLYAMCMMLAGLFLLVLLHRDHPVLQAQLITETAAAQHNENSEGAATQPPCNL